MQVNFSMRAPSVVMLSVCLSVFLSVCLPVCLPACLPVCEHARQAREDKHNQ